MSAARSVTPSCRPWAWSTTTKWSASATVSSAGNRSMPGYRGNSMMLPRCDCQKLLPGLSRSTRRKGCLRLRGREEIGTPAARRLHSGPGARMPTKEEEGARLIGLGERDDAPFTAAVDPDDVCLRLDAGVELSKPLPAVGKEDGVQGVVERRAGATTNLGPRGVRDSLEGAPRAPLRVRRAIREAPRPGRPRPSSGARARWCDRSRRDRGSHSAGETRRSRCQRAGAG